jgi:AhpD family alkylhydroperoxidase
MIAVAVSSVNDCNYCQIDHSEALNKYWKDEKRVNVLSKDFIKANLNPVEE